MVGVVVSNLILWVGKSANEKYQGGIISEEQKARCIHVLGFVGMLLSMAHQIGAGLSKN